MTETIPRNALDLAQLLRHLNACKKDAPGNERLPVAILTRKGVVYLGPAVTVQEDRILIDTTESLGGR